MFRKIAIILTTAAMLMTASSCASAGQTTTKQGSTETTQTGITILSGKVIVDGSGTVYPLMAAIAEKYMTEAQSDVSVQVGRAGTSAGFKKFIPGETDFSDASRAIKDEEIAQLKEEGLELGKDVLEIKLALDGLTFVINKDNTWAAAMTREEITGAFLSGSHKADDKVLWSDIRAGWPAEEVHFYGPNENHGTYEFFYEKILEKKDLVKTINLQQEYSTLVDLVSKDKNAIAFFGFGYYSSNQDKITAVQVDFGNGPVEPTLETIGENAPYAGFTRPVYTYLNVKYAREKPQVMDFAKYILETGAPGLAGESGFAPLTREQYAATLAQLKDLVQG